MVIDISSLPEFGSNITQPSFDQVTTDVGKLILEGDGPVNPLTTSLGIAITNLTSVNNLATGDLSQANIQDAIDNMEPVGPSFPISERTSLLTSLAVIKTIMALFNTQAALDNANSLLTHSDLLINNVTLISSVINQTISFGKFIQTDIPGGLPTDFPPIPSFNGLTVSFDGASAVSAIPTLNLLDIAAIGGIDPASGLDGVNAPGVPVPDDILQAFAGSILADTFGGVGTTLATNTSAIAAAALVGMSPLATVVANIQAVIDDGAALSLLVTATATATNTFTPALTSLSPTFGEYESGLSDLIVSENEALLGQSNITLFAGFADVPKTASGAFAEASSITNLVKFKSGAKLISSVGSTNLKTLLDLP